MGLSHDKYDTAKKGGSPLTPYSFGYHIPDTKAHTIMAYPHGNQRSPINVYSNPKLETNGHRLGKVGDKTLIFGLDANTYEAKRDGYQNAEEYQAHIVEKGLASQRGNTKDMDPKLYTTFNARTYLQPQLNKAVSYEERFTNVNVDRNPG